MKKWFKDNLQGLAALTCATGLFLGLGPILQKMDPGAGIVDLGALHVIIFSVKLLAGVSLGWLIIAIEFKFLDKYMDNGALFDDWKEMNPQTRATLFITVFLGLVLAFALLCG